jgi:alkylated DNA repair protein (DNA oxidative demethylase)
VNLELFAPDTDAARAPWRFAEGAMLLGGFALPGEATLLDALHDIIARAPLRHMQTPGGLRMSVAMTNCGALGWISDRRGYRYATTDPDSGELWPAMPHAFAKLAARAASAAGFDGFAPDACLVNRYEPGTRLTLHQDRNERDFDQPIVSVSLGMPARFLFGGERRADRAQRIPLAHGDVAVWGGPARLRYHGIAPLKEQPHPVLGAFRYNLTLRKAG